MQHVETAVREFLVRFLTENLPKISRDWWLEGVVRSLSEQQYKTFIEQRKASKLQDLDLRALLRALEKNWIGDGKLGAMMGADYEVFNHIKGVINAFNRDAHKMSLGG